jgi:hypothetical protein
MTEVGFPLRAGIAALLLGGLAPAQAVGQALVADCKTEIATHCAGVTPGQDRLVACLIAHEDKVSPRCRLTVYLSSGELDARMKALRGFAKTCSSDILQYCSKVPAGGGRIYDCLKKNQATLTDECRKAAPQFEKLMAD